MRNNSAKTCGVALVCRNRDERRKPVGRCSRWPPRTPKRVQAYLIGLLFGLKKSFGHLFYVARVNLVNERFSFTFS